MKQKLKTPMKQKLKTPMKQKLKTPMKQAQVQLAIQHVSGCQEMPVEKRPRRSQRQQLFKGAFSYDPAKNYRLVPQVGIGGMTDVCEHCNARKWPGEVPSLCCNNGKTKLSPLKDPPELLKQLLSESTPRSKHFRENVWRYNMAFTMTSFGADKDLTDRGFFTTYKIQGQCYHRIGSLLPMSNTEAKYVQVYFLNGDEEAQQRCKLNEGARPDIIQYLQEMIHGTHPYVSSLKYAVEHMHDNTDCKVVIHADKRPTGEHARRFNLPTTSEVAIVMVNEEHGKRDIILRKRDNQLTSISDTHRSYDCLQYPLLFPYGEDGYHFEMRQVDPTTGLDSSKSLSSKAFYSYRLMVRNNAFNQLLRFGKVTSQYMVDMYAKIESERLLFIKLNQRQLRAEQYIHLQDAMNEDANPSNIGQRVILPSSFTGSPRYMHQRTQDAMAYVRKHGKPDLFITFTCNPKWDEIKNELFEGQTQFDRHDLTARVFHEKLKKLISLLKDLKIFGETQCWMYTVEWQKRGLPHSHILLWLKEKIRASDIDLLISAELPSPNEDPMLFETISTQMVHGPCGNFNRNAPCMQDGHCTKNYPKQFINETQTAIDGYPLYRRRKPEDGGHVAKLKVRGNHVEIDNRWIVPHNPLLSKIFNAHINVEACMSVKSIKYICKYVNKGSDMAAFGIQEENLHDEVRKYQIGRYISSNEAVWRIFGFDIHQRYPTVVNLAVHLENGQRVFFSENTARQVAESPPQTTLTAFFKLCQHDTFAQTLLYNEVPSYYTWNGKKWSRRKQGSIVPECPDIRLSEAIGRVYTVHPRQQECFYLRLLLHIVRGPKSFTELRTYENEVCATNKEACLKRGLLEDDSIWDQTLQEAATTKAPDQLRQLFAVMLTTCSLSEPLTLWENHRDSMAEDVLNRCRQQNKGDESMSFCQAIYNEALLQVQNYVQDMNGNDLTSYGLPQPEESTVSTLPSDYLREISYNSEQLAVCVQQNEFQMTDDQKMIYNLVLCNIEEKKGGLFFLDAPGGTGKTFLLNTLLAKIREQGKIALAVASSGIAATLLHGGRTAHSAFKLPLDLSKKENPTCNISRRSAKAQLLQDAQLIIWNEATMSHRGAYEALDTTLQDIRSNGNVMGGLTTVLLAGDFRQILPVVQRGTRADEIKASLKSSHLWNKVIRLHLTKNMRVHLTGNESAAQFAEQLLQIGNDSIPASRDGFIVVPFGHFVETDDDLIAKVFPALHQQYTNTDWLCERAILAPKNTQVTDINEKLLAILPGSETHYVSVNSVSDLDDAIHYPVEFLNSLEIASLPPHNLILKVGAPIMLLRNLNPPKLCNGTRLIVKKLMTHAIEATIMTGNSKGEDVFIPKIPLIPSDTPFQFRRLQLPVRLSFAMTVNKSQGQSLQVVGLNLIEPPFTHGQLYVGCSRVGVGENIFISSPGGRTRNIVYHEALLS